MVGDMPAETLYQGFEHVGRTLATGFFENVAWAAVSLAIFCGALIAQWAVDWLLWKILTARCCMPRKRSRDVADAQAEHYPVKFESQQVGGQCTFVTVSDTRARRRNPPGVPNLIPQPSPLGVNPLYQQKPVYEHKPRPKGDNDGKNWHGHKRNRYDSWVRLICLVVRMFIVTGGIFFAFHVAGVNFFSLAVSVGVVTLIFTYGAGGLIANTFAALYMYSTDRVEIGDFIRVGSYFGVVVALRVQWITIVNDWDPWMGRQIIDIPNKISMETPYTRFPDGPPIKLRVAKAKALKEIAALHAKEQD